MLESDKSLDVSKITTKTMMIWGTDDHMTPLRQGEKMHELLKNSKLTIKEGWRHSHYLQDIKETAAEIAKQYEAPEGGGSGGNAKMIYLEQDYDTGEILTNLEPNLPMEYFLGAYFAVDDDERTPDRCEYNIVQRIEPELGGSSDVIGYSMIFKSYSLSYYINDGHIVMPD